MYKLNLFIRRGDATLYFLLFFFLFLITLFLGVLFMSGETGSAPNNSPPSTRDTGNGIGGSGGKRNNESNFSGFDSPSRESEENKNKKVKHSHNPVNSSYSQFPPYIHSDLERRNRYSMLAKSSINQKKTEIEIAKLKASIKPLSDKTEGDLCKAFSDRC